MRSFVSFRQPSADRWAEMNAKRTAYYASPEFKAKAKSAALIWRSLGWALVAGPLVIRFWFPHAVSGIAATAVLSSLVQLLAAFGVAYAALIRGTAISAHHRLHRVPNHLFGYSGRFLGRLYNEHWYDLIPGSEGVNSAEYHIRKHVPGLKGSKAHDYFIRTVIAALLCRFWWVGVAFAGACWWFGWSPVVAWLGMVGHRI
jgi:hypothetical protein